MSKIIKFYKKTPEDKLFESLNENQIELFEEMLKIIAKEFMDMEEQIQKLQLAYAKKCAECETLKLEIDLLKEKK